MSFLDEQLRIIQETDHIDPAETFDLEKLKKLITFSTDVDEKDFNINRQQDQPTLFDLIKYVGGDYRGRTTTRNSKHKDYAGIELLKKQLPPDWKERIRSYIKNLTGKNPE